MPTQTCVARDSLLFYPKWFYSMIILQPSSGVGRQFCTCSVILGQIYKPRGFCCLVQSLLTSVETPLISSEHRMSGSNLLQPCEPVSGLCFAIVLGEHQGVWALLSTKGFMVLPDGTTRNPSRRHYSKVHSTLLLFSSSTPKAVPSLGRVNETLSADSSKCNSVLSQRDPVTLKWHTSLPLSLDKGHSQR